MAEILFNTLAKKYFEFLISDYGFTIVEYDSQWGDENPTFYGRIIYSSHPRGNDMSNKQTGVQVTVDRGYVHVDIGPFEFDRDKEEWLALSEILRKVKPEAAEFDEPDVSQSHQIILEMQLAKLSDLVKQNCGSFLRGDFSSYNDFITARIKWREEYIKKIKEEIAREKQQNK